MFDKELAALRAKTVVIPGVVTSPRTVNVFVITRMLSRDARGLKIVGFGFLVYTR